MSRTRHRRFRLTLEAIPPTAREGMAAPPPVEVRLRAALMCLLRQWGLRCTEMIEELPTGPARRPPGQEILRPERAPAARRCTGNPELRRG
jgi:hypothetical protein